VPFNPGVDPKDALPGNSLSLFTCLLKFAVAFCVEKLYAIKVTYFLRS
jgi:hypothetical protein